MKINIPEEEKKQRQSYYLTEKAISELKKFKKTHKIKNSSKALDAILKSINK